MKTRLVIFAVAAVLQVLPLTARDYSVKSPDGRLQITLHRDTATKISITKDAVTLLEPSEIAMIANQGGELISPSEKVRMVSRRSVDRVVAASVYKKSTVSERFNEVTLKFKHADLVLRAYNDGVAYRFASNLDGEYCIVSETADYKFPHNWDMYIPYVSQNVDSLESQFFNSFESIYDKHKISEWNAERMAFLPVGVQAGKYKMCITETDVHSYPGMFLYKGKDSTSVSCRHARYPLAITQGGHNNLQDLVDERADYIARVDGSHAFPWRVFVIADTQKDVLGSDITWLLSSEPEGDYDWVKPGKVAWDWWNNWNLYGVDFRAGINNETYRYFIDFASENGIEYVILDEGWATKGKADLFDVIPQIDIPALCSYASDKGVGLVLWAGYKAFASDMEHVCKHYSELGVKGFKIDFMDRDDQLMMEFCEKAAQTAAKYKMLVDFHGAFKPVGFQRQYPNVLNHEGVYGQEQRKWNRDVDQVTYDVTFPFIRMVAGPVDYTQGAMMNANQQNFRPIYREPMSMGTRCHQLAEYVVFESPINMLCDSPSNYNKEKECLDFIVSCPLVWDETIPLAGVIGEFVAVARRSGDAWYIGALNNWTARDIEIDLGFLPEGSFKFEIYQDGINADRAARDYKRCVAEYSGKESFSIHLAPGGGWVAKVTSK